MTFGWNWGLGLEIWIEDWDWGLGLGIGNGDWDWGLGFGIWDLGFGISKELGGSLPSFEVTV